MAEQVNAFVRLETAPEDTLFQMPPAGRELREGDEFQYTGPGGSTRYKVESVDYRIEEGPGGTPSEARMVWRSPEVYYGVSIVI
jgi:hypothetical protein|tara:strand:+ start:10438 stop:10689 length:252 start_codon:yes stop_codon:yes gene_type:complete